MATVYSLICFGGRTGKTVSLSATTDVVTLTDHGLRNGTKLWPSGTLPSELNTSTPVYARSTASNTFTLHTSSAGAIANTGQIFFIGSSTFAAVVLKSDLVGDPANSLAAYGLSDLSRWGSSGSERIYDGIASFVSSRSGASPFDEEIAEIGEAFTELRTSALAVTLPSGALKIHTKIGDIRTPAFHAGAVGAGYIFSRTMTNGAIGLNLTQLDTVLDGFTVAAHSTGHINGTGVQLGAYTRCQKMIASGNSLAGIGFAAINSGAKLDTCLSTGWASGGTGIQIARNLSALFIVNTTSAGNDNGITVLSGYTSGIAGYFYGNVIAGNTTTNWPSVSGQTVASYNAGASGMWVTGGNPTITVGSGDFINLAGGDYRPALSSSPQVDTGVVPFGFSDLDLADEERPNYNNGGAEGVDVGCFEFDNGYGPHPTSLTRGLAFTGLVAGSELKVFETGTTTTVFSDTNTATSETWSENSTGSKTVDYTILKDGYVPIRVSGITVTGADTGGVLATPVQQVISRSWATPSGLTLGSNATITVGTKRVTVSAATTGQNWFNFMVQCWRTESSLANVQFPFSDNGPNSFQLADGWQFSSGLNYITRDGIRYVNSSGVVTDVWAAVLSTGVPSGMTVRYAQSDGGTVQSATNTGNIDQLIKIYENGSYDRTGFLVLKVQGDGYDQAEFDLVGTFGTLEDQLYVAGLVPLANGIASGTVTGITITDHGASPVTWNSKQFSITITDTGSHTGEQIVQYVRGLNSFNYHDLVQTNGTEYKTVRGKLYGDSGASLKGVRVVQSDGTTSHADFNLHTADDGTTYIPPLPPAAAEATILADSRVQLFNVTTDTEIDNVFVTGTGYSYVITSEASDGDVLRLRVCKLGKEAGEAFAVWGASGATFLISQPDSAEYTTWGIDGSTVTEFSGDVTGHIYIDANDLDGATTKTRLGAWYSWVLTTEIGIRHFFGAITYVSSAAIRINTDIADILIENTNATTALRFTDLSVRLYRSDGSSVIAPTSYSIHNDYSGVPDVVETGVSGLTGSESAQLMGLPDIGDFMATTIPVDIQKVNGQTINGTGSESDPWGP
jgi:hypothetical protein